MLNLPRELTIILQKLSEVGHCNKIFTAYHILILQFECHQIFTNRDRNVSPASILYNEQRKTFIIVINVNLSSGGK